MHPRNLYTRSPDFTALANSYPPLRPHVFLTHTGPSIDFKNPAAQRCLTEALLYVDFQISLGLPNDRLCPPVPNRLNYVLWIQDIVKAIASGVETVRGIDIGTGASAIYPLLACRLESTWQFVATDVDKESLASARENVRRNNLSNRIKIMEASTEGNLLLPLDEDPMGTYEFIMCNPPFYSSPAEVAQSAEAKEYGPHAVCMGTETEMITPGGEVAFVSRMFSESLRHRNRCRWYTSMLGKMTSLFDIIALFRGHEVDNYAITEFVQGQTRRWAVAWSLDTCRIPDVHARIASPALQNIMPQRTTLYQQLCGVPSQLVLNHLSQVLTNISGITITRNTTMSSLGGYSALVYALGDTWSRSARRRKAAPGLQSDPASICSSALQCRIVFWSSTSIDNGKHKEPCLEYQWVDGRERSVFESFVSHVNRKLSSSITAARPSNH